ncbi:MAG: Lrp/AsnC family transcriptional regulator [Micavibrio sp.]|nr:Lrp/AsnC family transcriptional regulator [Micavibrio sp.]
MRGTKLDKIDRKILQNLQKDGRMSNVELAKDVGISAPPCLRRVRALEKSGHIKSYYARIDAAVLGYGVTVFAMVKLNSQAEKDLEAFEQKMQQWPRVRECHMLAGDVDFLLKIVAKDWDAYQDFLTHQLTSLSNVISVKSSLGIRSAKEMPGVPIDDD